jgi:putative PIN family toxin of toxin-antitoxin system
MDQNKVDCVIDTNVIVSGLYSPTGFPAEVLNLVRTAQVTPVYDPRILLEYERVLSYDKFSFSKDMIKNTLDLIVVMGRSVKPARALIDLPDPADLPFYECALETTSKILVTGNLKHFPARQCGKIHVQSPRDFIASN